MGFAWLGRLAALAAAMAPLALIVDCGFRLQTAPWRGEAPGYCVVDRFLFGAAAPSDDPMMIAVVPQWRLLPAYGVLRSATFDIGPLDSKTIGVILLCAVLAAPLSLAFYAWGKLPARAGLCLILAPLFVIGLGWVGAQNPTPMVAAAGQALIVGYFLLFAVALPLLARRRE